MVCIGILDSQFLEGLGHEEGAGRGGEGTIGCSEDQSVSLVEEAVSKDDVNSVTQSWYDLYLGMGKRREDECVCVCVHGPFMHVDHCNWCTGTHAHTHICIACVCVCVCACVCACTCLCILPYMCRIDIWGVWSETTHRTTGVWSGIYTVTQGAVHASMCIRT